MSTPTFVEKPVVRLVLPFEVAPGRLSELVKALVGEKLLDEKQVWAEAKPRNAYVDELTQQAEAMLFAGKGERHSGAFLRVDGTVAQRWFQGAVLQPEGHEATRIKLVPELGIELFLSGHGCGAFSISFELAVDTVSALQDTVYRLAQRVRRRSDPSWIRVPHPADDAERLAQVPAEQRAKLEAEERPAREAALHKRLGKRGGQFTLHELADALLGPLGGLGLQLREGSFHAYTVARFAAGTSLAPDSALADALLGVAQVEEAAHAGGGREPVQVALLNSCHLAGVASQGAAHFVADQSGVAFNDERQGRVRDKYFVPFLVATLQRAALRRLGTFIHATLADEMRSADSVRQLRLDLLELAAGGMASEVSTRGAVESYSARCRAALAVTETFEQTERAIAGIEQVLTSQKLEDLLGKQEKIAARSEKSLEAAHSLHAAVAWLEIFIVTAYTAEVLHILWAAYEHGGDHPIQHVLVYVAAMVIAGGIAAWVLKPWSSRGHH
jgi:hypothetical protein